MSLQATPCGCAALWDTLLPSTPQPSPPLVFLWEQRGLGLGSCPLERGGF